jgi:hypothetical protein
MARTIGQAAGRGGRLPSSARWPVGQLLSSEVLFALFFRSSEIMVLPPPPLPVDPRPAAWPTR